MLNCDGLKHYPRVCVCVCVCVCVHVQTPNSVPHCILCLWHVVSSYAKQLQPWATGRVPFQLLAPFYASSPSRQTRGGCDTIEGGEQQQQQQQGQGGVKLKSLWLLLDVSQSLSLLSCPSFECVHEREEEGERRPGSIRKESLALRKRGGEEMWQEESERLYWDSSSGR